MGNGSHVVGGDDIVIDQCGVEASSDGAFAREPKEKSAVVAVVRGCGNLCWRDSG